MPASALRSGFYSFSYSEPRLSALLTLLLPWQALFTLTPIFYTLEIDWPLLTGHISSVLLKSLRLRSVMIQLQ